MSAIYTLTVDAYDLHAGDLVHLVAEDNGYALVSRNDPRWGIVEAWVPREALEAATTERETQS